MSLTRRSVSLLALAALLGAAAARLLVLRPWEEFPPPEPPVTPADTGFADVNGLRIYYAVWGAGEPVLLLHGGLGNSDFWGPQINALAGSHKVIAIDSRGHGRSSWDGAKLNYELMASDVLGVLDQLHAGKVALVGWSDGAIVGLVLAMEHPERLTKVFAFGANVDPSGLKPAGPASPAARTYAAKARADYARLSPRPQDFDVFAAAANDMWNNEPHYGPQDLARIGIPVTIADGADDADIEPAHTMMMAKAIPGARLVIMPGLSHYAMWEDPAGFNRLLAEFLAR